MSYVEAMDKYGCDKPDLRFDLPLADLSETLLGKVEFRVFADVLSRGGIVKCLHLPEGVTFTRKDLDVTFPQEAAPHGAKGVAWARVNAAGEWSGPVAKGLSEDLRLEINQKLGTRDGSLILFVADKAATVNASLARLRLVAGQRLG